MIAAEVKHLIESSLSDSQVVIRDFTGSGDHLEVNVIWPGFSGMSRVKQHQHVYAIVQHLVGDGRPVHALTMKTWATPPEQLASPADAYFGG